MTAKKLDVRKVVDLKFAALINKDSSTSIFEKLAYFHEKVWFLNLLWEQMFSLAASKRIIMMLNIYVKLPFRNQWFSMIFLI